MAATRVLRVHMQQRAQALYTIAKRCMAYNMRWAMHTMHKPQAMANGQAGEALRRGCGRLGSRAVPVTKIRAPQLHAGDTNVGAQPRQSNACVR